MKQKEFDNVVNHRLEKCKEILGVKGGIYADKNDRLKNFYDGASFNECTPEQYAHMLVTSILSLLKTTSLTIVLCLKPLSMRRLQM